MVEPSIRLLYYLLLDKDDGTLNGATINHILTDGPTWDVFHDILENIGIDQTETLLNDFGLAVKVVSESIIEQLKNEKNG